MKAIWVKGSVETGALERVIQCFGKRCNAPVNKEERNDVLIDQALHAFVLYVESCHGSAPLQ